MRPTTTNDPSALCTPPQSCLNPLLVLDQYLASLEQPRTDTSNSTLKETTTTLKRQDEILQTVEFLYGSALDGALSVLDSTTSSVPGRSSSVTAAPPIASTVTRFQSPQRSLYMVAASSVRGRAAAAAGLSTAVRQQDSYYLCILPADNQHDTTTNSSTSTGSSIYYCSCRSFLEKSRSNSSNSSHGATTLATAGVSLCKHLLALKLMPVLGWTCSTIHFTSEEEFSHALLQRLSPGY